MRTSEEKKTDDDRFQTITDMVEGPLLAYYFGRRDQAFSTMSVSDILYIGIARNTVFLMIGERKIGTSTKCRSLSVPFSIREIALAVL